MFKKVLISSAIALALTGKVAASGVPTVDLAAIAQAVQTVAQLKAQYEMLTNQYSQMQQQYQSMTGSRGLGMIFHDPAVQHLMTQEASRSLSSVFAVGKSALSREALEIYNARGFDRECQGMTEEARLSCEKGMAATAAYQAHLQSTARVAKERMNTVVHLMGQINQVHDSKAIADLQARIQAEQVQLQLAEAEARSYASELNYMMQSEDELRYQRALKSVYSSVSRDRIKELLSK